MTNPNTGDKLDGCIRKILDNQKIFTYTYGDCNSIEVPLTIVLGEKC